jgi:hypothetical protein
MRTRGSPAQGGEAETIGEKTAMMEISDPEY